MPLAVVQLVEPQELPGIVVMLRSRVIIVTRCWSCAMPDSRPSGIPLSAEEGLKSSRSSSLSVSCVRSRHLVVVCFRESIMVCMQGLLRELLSELDRQDPRRVQVLEAYGEQLAERNLAEDSAVAYLAAGALERSLLQYKLAGQWQMAFCLAGKGVARPIESYQERAKRVYCRPESGICPPEPRPTSSCAFSYSAMEAEVLLPTSLGMQLPAVPGQMLHLRSRSDTSL